MAASRSNWGEAPPGITVWLDPSLVPVPQALGNHACQNWIPENLRSLDLVHHDLDALSEPGTRRHTSYVDYIFWAWTHHRTVVLSPDLFWFECLATVAKSMTDCFARSYYMSKFQIPDDAIVEFMSAVVGRLDVKSMAASVESAGIFPFDTKDVFMPRFSTTTDRSRLAAMACFCDIASTSMRLREGCGFPAVRLQGNIRDWTSLSRRLQDLGDIFDRSRNYLGQVAEIADEIARLSREGDVSQMQGFFAEFIRSSREPCGSGHEVGVMIRGWITRLYGLYDNAEIRDFPELVAKVVWTDDQAPDSAFVGLAGVFGSVDDEEGVPIPDFGQAVFHGRSALEQEKILFKKQLDRGHAGVIVALALHGSIAARAQIDEGDAGTDGSSGANSEVDALNGAMVEAHLTGDVSQHTSNHSGENSDSSWNVLDVVDLPTAISSERGQSDMETNSTWSWTPEGNGQWARHCFLPGTRIRNPHTGGLSESISCVEEHQALRGGRGLSHVWRRAEYPSMPRDVVQVRYSSEDGRLQGMISLTAHHSMLVRTPNSRAFSPLPAGDIRQGDVLRAVDSDVVVDTVDSLMLPTRVLSLEFENRSDTVFACGPDSPSDLFVEVFGELAPRPAGDFVKMLRFRHFHGLNDALRASPQLSACQDALIRAGFPAQPFPRGYLVVDDRIASAVIMTVEAGSIALTPRDVIVSKAFERGVLDAVRNHVGTRHNWVVHEQPMDIGRTNHLWLSREDLCIPGEGESAMRVVVERTFIHLQRLHRGDSASVATRSTTDARMNGTNPRVLAQRFRPF